MNSVCATRRTCRRTSSDIVELLLGVVPGGSAEQVCGDGGRGLGGGVEVLSTGFAGQLDRGGDGPKSPSGRDPLDRVDRPGGVVVPVYAQGVRPTRHRSLAGVVG